MIKKAINACLLLLAIVLPLGLLLRVNVFPNVYVAPQDVLVSIIFILTLIHFTTKKRLPKGFSIFKYLMLFVVVGVISACINAFLIPNYNIVVALLYAVRYILYASLLFVGEIVGVTYKKWLVIAGGVIVVFGFIQYLFYNNLGNLSYLGWDNHLYRLFSTFFDPNFAGAFYAIFFFFSIPFIYQSVKDKDKVRTALYMAICVLTVLSIFFTHSRTSFIMLVAGVVACLITFRKYALLGVSLVGMVLFLLAVSDFTVEGLNPLRTASSAERLKSARQATKIIIDNPLIGVGFNGYRYAQVHYGFRTEQGARVSNADAGTDNSYLFAFATTGMFGLVAFLFTYMSLLRRIKKTNLPGVLLLSTTVAVLVGSLFLNILFYTPILVWLYLILGAGFGREIKVDK